MVLGQLHYAHHLAVSGQTVLENLVRSGCTALWRCMHNIVAPKIIAHSSGIYPFPSGILHLTALLWQIKIYGKEIFGGAPTILHLGGKLTNLVNWWCCRHTA